LKSRISFTDYYAATALPAPTGKPIEIFDPVNPTNHAAAMYDDAQRKKIVNAGNLLGPILRSESILDFRILP
jgi:hypothetical protein